MIIDTFLFSEPHEDDLLFLKFQLEDKNVDYWVIQENTYTLQGDKKGVFADKVLEQPRFKPYLHKVVLLSTDYLIQPNNKDENVNFVRENWQRTISTSWILSNITEESHIIVSDVDESLDFSDPVRQEKLLNILNNHKNDLIYIGRMRYWYDYDNRCYLPNIRIPVISSTLLKQQVGLYGNVNLLGQVRHMHGITYDAGEAPLAFEYSYVFKDMEDVWRKKCTYAHTNFTRESIEIGLECNHWPRTMNRGEKVGDKYDFFEFVTLNEQNSPKYVRDNLEQLKTNIVNKNYKEARRIRYGI